MKSIIATILFLIPFILPAQETEPQMIVQQTMLAKYPGAKKIKWQQEGESNWEAEFKWDGIKYEVVYDQDGNRLETERELMDDEIPERFRKALANEYPDHKIVEAEWLETLEGIFYEFELKGADGEVEVMMDSNCKILTEDEKGAEEDDAD